MNGLIEQVDSHLDGTVSVVKINGSYDDHKTLLRSVADAEIKLSSLFPAMVEGQPDPLLALHPTITHIQGEGALRDPVSTEYIPHLDGTWLDIRPLATMVVARAAGVNPPPTRFISPIGLFELAKEAGIFRNFDPSQVDAVFGYSAYYNQAQRFFKQARPDDERLKEVMRDDLVKNGVSTLEELIEKFDNDPIKGPRRYPMVSRHTVTGQDSLLMDAGVRHIGFAPYEGGSEVSQEVLDEALINLRLLLAGVDRLDDAGITATVTPRTGFGVAFPKETIHHAVPTIHDKDNPVIRHVSVLGLIPAIT